MCVPLSLEIALRRLVVWIIVSPSGCLKLPWEREHFSLENGFRSRWLSVFFAAYLENKKNKINWKDATICLFCCFEWDNSNILKVNSFSMRGSFNWFTPHFVDFNEIKRGWSMDFNCSPKLDTWRSILKPLNSSTLIKALKPLGVGAWVKCYLNSWWQVLF